MISINVYEIFMQMVNFLILLYLLNKFMIKPLGEFMDKRSKDLDESIKLTESNKIDSEKLLEEQKNLLKEARIEAKQIREKAEGVGNNERTAIIENAKKEAAQLVNNAKRDVELSVNKAKKDLLLEIGDLAVMLSEKILGRSINPEDKDKIVSDGLGKLSAS